MPDEEVKPVGEVKQPEEAKSEEVKPPEAPKPEPVIVEPQRELNPFETRLEALEKRLNDRDEKEKIEAEKSKEVKHAEVQEKQAESDRGNERNNVLQKTKADEGSGGTAGGSKPEGSPQPAKRVHRFKFKSRKPASTK